MSRLRIGIVGCGEATQILHLPSLRQLDDRFEIVAVCDASRDVADTVARDWAVPAASIEPAELFARGDLDAVLIASPDETHAPLTVAALDAGKHVLVEKPMAVTLRQADEISAAQERSGLVVQVGYMRLHAAAFAEARRLVDSLGEIRLARVHQVLGANALIIDPTSRVVRPGGTRSNAALEALMREAIGEVGPTELAAFRLLLGLSSHDLSVMRELLGAPERVLYATARHAGQYLTAAFDYGDYVCTFETGMDQIPRFDCHVEVYADDRVVRLEYDTPYVRNLPTRVSVVEANGSGGVNEHRSQPSWGDAFVTEWQAFHRSVSEGAPVRVSPRDFRLDLELFIELARAIEYD
ncbi:MAG: Gfo/Idh/MocA family oxidoreductase [Gaiellales bacterium]